MAQSNTSVHQGLADPVHDASAIFRAILETISRPGEIHTCPVTVDVPEGFNMGAQCFALALCDVDTSIWLGGGCDTTEVRKNLAFHCGTRFTTTPDKSDFVFAPATMPLEFLNDLEIGSEIYPDRSCSVVLLVEDMTGGMPVTLSGPGIETTATLAPKGVPEAFWRWAQDNHSQFPQGVDVFFAAPSAFAALPRSTEVSF